MKTIVKFISLFSLFNILFVACTDSSGKETNPEQKQSVLPTYAVTRVTQDTLTYELTLSGNLKPYESVTLFSKINGFVSNLQVDRGDKVEKEQLLMEIQAPEIQQKLLAARAKQRELLEKLQFSHQNYQRTKAASSVAGAVSDTRLQRAKTELMVDSASFSAVKAEVAAAAQLAQYTQIEAPFKGVITKRFVSSGALVGGGEKPLVSIFREDKLRLEVAIPSKHAKAVQADTKGYFVVNSYPGEKFPINLSRSSRALDPNLRSVMVEFDYDNAEGLLNAGDYAEVHLQLKRRLPSLQVPSSSLIITPDNTYVAKVVKGKVALVPVTTGLTLDKQVGVYGNIEAGDQIIAKGNSTLKDGMAVEVRQTQPAP